MEHRPPLTRSRDDRVVAGVCAGIARRLGVDPVVVRLATVLLSLANAVGIILYLGCWFHMPKESDETSTEVRKEGSLKNAAAIGCITVGVLVLVRAAVPLFPDQVVWPATLAAAGLGLMWARANEEERARWRAALSGRLPGGPLALLTGAGLGLRLAIGGSLLICGIAWFLGTNSAVAELGAVGLAVVATVLGVTILLGPWIAGLFRQLGAERSERIRSEERADMAAHLHDSVLQTLALIQRQAESPQQTRTLARRQERELRAWLYEDRTPGDGDGRPRTLAAALDRLSDDVEADHDVTVDAVVVGDRPLDPRTEALVGALREAVVNAALHSGEQEVSVYVEVEPDGIEAYVRDRGKGFDPAHVDVDRRGIAQSILGRMTRHAGWATVRSAPGEGTEVALRLPQEPGT